jgi:hypothetical protein
MADIIAHIDVFGYNHCTGGELMKLRKAKQREKQQTSGKALVYVPGGAKTNLTSNPMNPPPLDYEPLTDLSQPPPTRRPSGE